METKDQSYSSLRDVTNEVTKEKLALLEEQRKSLRSHYETILKKYDENPELRSSLQFLKEIHTTLEKCPDGENPAPDRTQVLSVFFNWLDNNEDEGDKLIYFGTEQLVQDWISELVKCIKSQVEKCEYSCLYASAMTQYMDSGKEPEASEPESEDGKSKLPGTSGSKKETILEFEKRVFAAPAPEGFDIASFDKLLEEKLFDMKNPTEEKQLLGIRERTVRFCEDFSKPYGFLTMNNSDLQFCIDALIQEDLLGPQKALTLKELRENNAALTEVCTLLNKRVKNFKNWNWPSAVQVSFRRNMAGRYRAYMDEDILTAILLHFIGAKWSIYFKRCFKSIYSSKMWKRGTGTLGDLYYQPGKSNGSIESLRREFHSKCVLTVLPDSMGDLASSAQIYDDDDVRTGTAERGIPQVAAFSAPMPAMRAMKKMAAPVHEMECELEDAYLCGSNSSASGGAKREKALTPTKIKQRLLHTISTEIHLNNVLRPEKPLTVVQTDMEWFGPSLIHKVVLSVMKYFGVTSEWLQFFQRFLEAPLKIVGGTSDQVHTRKRGAPISHQLTTLFGESLLFVMELYVNRESELSIFRIHDDLWFWNHRSENVVKAWESMQTFTKLAGLKLNKEKSSSVVCDSRKEDKPKITYGPEPLPQNYIQWGFIVLHSDGVFRISDQALAPHIKEMKEHLEKADSVMNWIHSHNKYVRFFIRNFAEPASTFGKQHIVQIMTKLKDILKQVHSETKGDAVQALKRKFPQVFKGKDDVMDSWVHWAVKEGGLSLDNPFLELIPLHEAYRELEENRKKFGGNSDKDNNNAFADVCQNDKQDWDRRLQESKERRQRRSQSQQVPLSKEELEEETITDDEEDNPQGPQPPRPPRVMRVVDPFDKPQAQDKKRVDFETRCKRFRETRWGYWGALYSSLLENPIPVGTHYGCNWKEALYNDQIERRLGAGVRQFVDGNLVPLSLISAMESERVHKN